MNDIATDLKANWKADLPAGVVVFLVALPLCLGIALASGAPLFSGVISGIVGGIVVGMLSGSPLSVSGPAAGLTLVVFNGIATAGSYNAFLAAGLVCAVTQVLLGVFRLGKVGSFFPSSVIKGMLAAIGIIIILKQIPHALGRDADFSGDESFFQPMDGENTFSEILRSALGVQPGAILISLIALGILIFWSSNVVERRNWLKVIPGPLLAVFVGTILNELLGVVLPDWKLTAETGAVVQIPILDSLNSLKDVFPSVDFGAILRPEILILGVSMALIASLESLLSLEATDRLDPLKRTSPVNRELVAQGVGNGVAAMLGGLPLTAVIVRSSANIYAGGRTRISAVFHGILLVLAVLLIPTLLNKVPLSALAAILLMVGYKLSSIKIFKSMFGQGWDQFLPFLVTVIAIIFSDILIGVGIGLAAALVFVLKSNSYSAFTIVEDGKDVLIRLRKDVSFLQKPRLKEALEDIAPGSTVYVDGSKAMFIDQDIFEFLQEYQKSALQKGISVSLHNLEGKSYSIQFRRLLGLELKSSK